MRVGDTALRSAFWESQVKEPRGGSFVKGHAAILRQLSAH